MRALAYVRSLAPGLSRRVWMLETGVLVNAFGNGVVYPFLLIYLHNVRGFGLPTAGLVLAVFGAISFGATTVAGAIVDHVGARPTLAGGLALMAVGFGALGLVEEPWQAFATMAVAGAGNGAFWPSQSSLLVALAPEDRRTTAFAVQRTIFNLGLAAGGVAGGLLASTADANTFTILFLVDAATFVLYGALLPLLGRIERPTRDRLRGRYRDVMADRAFVGLIALNVVFATVAYAQFEAIMPAFAMNEAGVSEDAIGFIYMVNMVTIVVAQLPVIKALEGRSRSSAFALAACFFGAAFIVILAAGSWLSGVAAAAVLAFAAVVFTVGEALHGPTASSLAADLAPERLRGRYLAVVTNSYAIGFAAGPAIGGAVLAASSTGLWVGAVLMLTLAGMAALALEPLIPVSLRLAPARPGEAVMAHRRAEAAASASD